MCKVSRARRPSAELGDRFSAAGLGTKVLPDLESSKFSAQVSSKGCFADGRHIG